LRAAFKESETDGAPQAAGAAGNQNDLSRKI
jgi:hypothetical protein